MSYQRIQSFPAPDEFTSPELQALTSVWKEKKSELENNGAYKDFLKKLQREWAIETGIIERLYTWDRGVTETLIEQGIESSLISHLGRMSLQNAEHAHALIHDHLGIVEGLFSFIKGDEPLSEYFIRGLQAQFTAHQDYTEAVTPSGDLIRVTLLKGEYKTQPNNPRRPDGVIHAFCPPEMTRDEMETLVQTYRDAEGAYPSEVKAAWLHHRFTQIHPFQDGNGRVARALASLVFLREGLFPLVVRESDRTEYIGALEAADAGDLSSLVTFFVRRQKESVLKALGLEQQVQQSKHADEIVASALKLLQSKFSKEKQKISVVYEHAEKLFEFSHSRLKQLVDSLDTQLKAVTPPQKPKPYTYLARIDAEGNASERRHFFHKQIVDIAKRKQFDYVANFEHHRSWIRVKLQTENEFDYVLSFHGYGPGDSGILSACAFTYLKVPGEDGKKTETVALSPAMIDLFQFNYVESFESTQERFSQWLEASIPIALAEWQRSLQG